MQPPSTLILNRPACRSISRPIGIMEAGTGALQLSDSNRPEVDDVLDDLGELVLKNGGQIVVVPSEQMPAKTGGAAACRF